MAQLQLNTDEIRRALTLFHGGSDSVFEIRLLTKGRFKKTYSGYFNDVETAIDILQQECFTPDDLEHMQCYFTFNSLNNSLLAREQFNQFVAGTTTTSDNDVTRIKWILIDLDPKRPADISSTTEELQEAMQGAIKLQDFLKITFHIESFLAMSGNGSHVWIKTDLAVSDSKELVKPLLEELNKYYSDRSYDIDRTVFNPARITKLYGTVATKGRNAEERPHRFSRLQSGELPNIDTTSRADIVKLYEFLKTANTPATDGTQPDRIKNSQIRQYSNAKAFDLESFLDDNSISYRVEQGNKPGVIKYTLDQGCVFDSNHKDVAIFKDPDGKMTYNCFHNSCNHTWQDFRKKYDPDYDPNKTYKGKYQKQSGSNTNSQTDETTIEITPEYFSSVSGSAGLNELLDRINTGYYEIHSTGIKSLDTALNGGIVNGVVTISGGTGTGKTTLALQIADKFAERGEPVLYFTLEMSRSELISRTISRYTYEICKDESISSSNAKTQKDVILKSSHDQYSKQEREVFETAVDMYRDFIAPNMHIISPPGKLSGRGLREIAEVYIEQTESKPLIVVDYLQLLSADNDRMTDQAAIDSNIMNLRQLARDYNCIVLAISSQNRSSYEATATLTALKGSGGIEYTADTVLMLQARNKDSDSDRSNEEEKRNKIRQLEIVPLKHRLGGLEKTVPVDYHAMFNVFTEVGEATEKAKGKKKKTTEEKNDLSEQIYNFIYDQPGQYATESEIVKAMEQMYATAGKIKSALLKLMSDHYIVKYGDTDGDIKHGGSNNVVLAVNQGTENKDPRLQHSADTIDTVKEDQEQVEGE